MYFSRVFPGLASARLVVSIPRFADFRVPAEIGVARPGPSGILVGEIEGVCAFPSRNRERDLTEGNCDGSG